MREEFTQGGSSKTPGRPEHEANKGTSDRIQARAGLVQLAMMLDLAAVWALFGPGEVMKSGSSEWTVPIRTGARLAESVVFCATTQPTAFALPACSACDSG